MYQLFEMINNLIKKIENIPYIELKKVVFKDRINKKQIEDVEKNLSIKFPFFLKEFYFKNSSGVQLFWKIKTDFNWNKNFKYGRFHLLSPAECLSYWQDQIEIVKESKLNVKEIENNPGLQALVSDWPFWIPIIHFPNGDNFCLDIREKNKDDFFIKFLEHDVMDGGPFIHGTLISQSLYELFESWSKIAFADVGDWYDVVNEKGIDLTLDKFKQIIEVFK